MINRILNIVGWIGFVLVLGAVGIRLGLPAKDQYAYYLAWGGLVCVLLYMLSQWREVVGMFGRRQTRYGTLAGVSILVVLGILIAINYIGKQQNKRWDFTAAQQFSLSDQSKNILAKLDSPLQIRVFQTEQGFQQFQDRLKEYEYVSKQVSIEYIDPDKKPAIAQQYGVTQYGTIVFSYKGRTERVTSSTEQDVTNGIIKVITGEQKKVYFTQGHGEKDPTDSGRNGYNTLADALKRENYTVEKVAIAQQGSVPSDAAVVIVAGPKNDFLPPEVDALKKYLAGGGKLLMELDPPDKDDVPPLTNLIALAHDWDIDVGNNIVVDVSGMGQLFGASEAVPIAVNYPAHPITERFNVMTVYPLTRSVSAIPGGVNNHNAQQIVETSPRSWAETNMKDLFASKPVQLEEAKGDKPGPVSIAAAVSAPVQTPADASKDASGKDAAKDANKPEGPKPETRVVVFGDSDFASNATIGVSGNRDLFMNVVGWLSQQENLISVRAKEAADRRITLTSAQQTNINWIAMLGIPVVIFGMGILNWYRRR
jgi:ABC-type uncharacterized transport system involved in gliding motility auxiliary subunit